VSHSVCVTCSRVIRDHDDVTGMPRQRLGLPPHGCANPVGAWTWNNGLNYWDDDVRDFVFWFDYGDHDPGDEDRQ
jgi:hypothetical protein